MEETEVIPGQKVKVRKWNANEMKVLIKLWKRHFVFKRQGNDKDNSIFYEAIRNSLSLYGYERSVNEIEIKTHCLLLSYRRAKKSVLKKGCIGNFPLFFDMIDIEKLELQTESENTKSGVDHSILSDERGEEIIEEENDPEDDQEPDEDVTKDNSLSVNNTHLPSNDLPATTEDILLGFYGAFQKTNRQLKRNDATLLELFNEQNEIFKKQANLIKRLLRKRKLV